MNRAALGDQRLAMYRTFAQRFIERGRTVSSPPMKLVAADDITEAEKTLNAFFPASIVQFWLAHGCGQLPGLVEASNVFPRPADALTPVAQLFGPLEVVAACREPWTGAMPVTWMDPQLLRDGATPWDYVLPIATDLAGNWFCMAREENIVNESEIYYLDRHNVIQQAAAGFEPWLAGYLTLPQRR